jgi:hypothetical protein
VSLSGGLVPGKAPSITEPELLLPSQRWAARPLVPPGPISRPEIEAAAADALARECCLDLRSYDLKHLDLGSDSDGTTWTNLIFGLNDRKPHASMDGCSFEHTTLQGCFFVAVELRRVDFTECELYECDLRFATFRGVRLGSVKMVGCDMYGAAIEAATIATGLRFERSTLPQFGDGITGLQWAAVAGKRPPSLAGEDRDYYPEFLKRTRYERPLKEGDVAGAVDERLVGAAAGYRQLSGYWTSQGRFQDANRAYARSRRIERRAAAPGQWVARRVGKEGSFGLSPAARKARRASASRRERYEARMLQPVRWAFLWLAEVTSCFGQSLTRVATSLFVVAVGPGIGYWISGGVKHVNGLPDDLLFSLARLTAFTPAGMEPATRGVEWAGVTQAVLGILLLGLFGYVLGNELRQS